MADVPEGSIVITPAQMYESTQKAIGEISSNISDLKLALAPLPTQIVDHEARLRRLERALWLGVGFAAALGSAAGTAASKLFG